MRPLGVTVIGITMLLSAALWLIIGIGLIMMLGIALIQVQPIPGSDAALGPILFLWGYFNYKIAFGLFEMRNRAWRLAIVSTLIGLFFTVVGIGIFLSTIAYNPYAPQLKGALIAIGIFQLLYLFLSYRDFREG